MNRKVTQVLLLFCFCFVAGYSMINYVTDAESKQVDRDPASIGKIYDFSHLKGDDLHFALKQRLLAGFEVQKNKDAQGVSLGHFVFVDASGQKKFACQEYNKISLLFEADGVAVGGETPKMRVEGECKFSTDVTRINPLWIPVAKILNEKPADGEIQFNQEDPISLSFSGLPSEWPKTWILKSVELKKESSAETLNVESPEIAKYFGHPVVLSF